MQTSILSPTPKIFIKDTVSSEEVQSLTEQLYKKFIFPVFTTKV